MTRNRSKSRNRNIRCNSSLIGLVGVRLLEAIEADVGLRLVGVVVVRVEMAVY